MKEILLQPVTTQDDKDLFIKEIQKAFQDAFEREYENLVKPSYQPPILKTLLMVRELKYFLPLIMQKE